MHDFMCSNPDEMFDSDMAEVTRYYKENKEGVKTVCKIMDDMKNEAKLRKAREIALKLIKRNVLSFEEIAEDTDISIEELKNLLSLNLYDVALV